MFILSENKYIFDGTEIKPRGWREIASFNTLEETRKYYHNFCYGAVWNDYKIEQEV